MRKRIADPNLMVIPILNPRADADRLLPLLRSPRRSPFDAIKGFRHPAVPPGESSVTLPRAWGLVRRAERGIRWNRYEKAVPAARCPALHLQRTLARQAP